MPTPLKTLWENRQAVLTKVQTLALSTEGRNPTQAERDEESRFVSQLDELDKQITKGLEEAEREQRSADAFARYERLQNGDAAGEVSPWLPGVSTYGQLKLEQRAIGTAGAFIPQATSTTFFDLLRKRTAVLAAGPVPLTVELAGTLKVPKVTSSVTIGSVAENVAITASDPGLADITLDPKKIAAMTLVAREAVEDSQPALRLVIGNALVRDLAVELDRQLVTGDGTANQMLGLRNIAGFTVGHTVAANGDALSFDILANTMAAADTANLDPSRLAWFMHSRSWGSVRKLKDTQNRPIFATNPNVDVPKEIFGAPVFISNSLSITETQGTSTNASTLLLVDMSQVTVGIAREVELRMSEDFAFNADQIALRVTARYDIGVPQSSAIVKTVGVLP